MAEYEIAWDPNKAKANLLKHGISFEGAATAFSDSSGRLMYGLDHSHSENCFILLAVSTKLRLMVVAHVYRKRGSEIRIISARKASKAEHEQYGNYL